MRQYRSTATPKSVRISPSSGTFLVQLGFVVPFAFGAALWALGAVLVWTQVEATVTERKSVFEL